MAIRARSLMTPFRVLLFVAIYLLTLRFVHTYPLPMPAAQQHLLFALSRRLGIRDPDDLYLYGFAILDFIVAIGVYLLVVKLWRIARRGRVY